jgi:hypothetical protein
MPVWRCPHCGTPQAESSRCWVCRRSTTTCATCRHFRRGIANGLGLCGLDPRHSALDGTEIRACWAAAVPRAADADGGEGRVPPQPLALTDADRRPARTFVLVDDLARPQPEPDPADLVPAGRATDPSPSSGGSLWDDPEG